MHFNPNWVQQCRDKNWRLKNIPVCCQIPGCCFCYGRRRRKPQTGSWRWWLLMAKPLYISNVIFFGDNFELCQKWIQRNDGSIRQAHFINPTFLARHDIDAMHMNIKWFFGPNLQKSFGTAIKINCHGFASDSQSTQTMFSQVTTSHLGLDLNVTSAWAPLIKAVNGHTPPTFQLQRFQIQEWCNHSRRGGK